VVQITDVIVRHGHCSDRISRRSLFGVIDNGTPVACRVPAAARTSATTASRSVSR